ncbi:hypothetical protein MUO66_04485 [Candidatus Bathyarchaeota archaeon]|nr:hypothetical protein [Candidatus Bathyarchaeota archaeon]
MKLVYSNENRTNKFLIKKMFMLCSVGGNLAMSIDGFYLRENKLGINEE